MATSISLRTSSVLFSPDGRYAYYYDWDPAGANRDGRLFGVRVDGSAEAKEISAPLMGLGMGLGTHALSENGRCLGYLLDDGPIALRSAYRNRDHPGIGATSSVFVWFGRRREDWTDLGPWAGAGRRPGDF